MARLAFILPTMGSGGAERVALSLICDFVRRGHSVDLVLLQAEGPLLELLPGEVRIFDLHARRIRHAIRRLVSYFRRERPDAVQVSMWPLTCVAVAAHQLSGSCARLVISDHTTLSRKFEHFGPFGRALMRTSFRWLYPKADARVAVSNGVADDLVSIALRRDSLEIIHNPTVLPATLETSAAAEALWGSGGARILNVGGLKEVKNQRLLLEAFAQVSDKSARLMILGEGELRQALEQRARELGISDRVIMPGFFSDPWPFYASADLFVLSSHSEGFGNVLVEALAAGLRIVSTDCPHGPAEILDRGRFGRLTPRGDADALARAIEEALIEPADREPLRRRPREMSGIGSAQRYLELMWPAMSKDDTRKRNETQLPCPSSVR